MTKLHAISIEFLDTGCIVKAISTAGDDSIEQTAHACGTVMAGREMVNDLFDQRGVESKMVTQ